MSIQAEISKEAEQFTADASATLIESRSIVVSSDEEAQGATTFLSNVKDKLKSVEDARKALVKPLNDHVKMINTEFKKTSIPLMEAQSEVKKSLSTYQMEKMRKQQEEQRAAAEKAEKERQEAMDKAKEQGKSELVAASKIKEEEVEEVENMICVDHGNGKDKAVKATFRTVWKFRITDATKIPAEYLVIDEKRIGADVRGGLREIEGVEIYSEQTVAV